MKSLIKIDDLLKKILHLKENDNYMLSYNRVNPKCENCGVSEQKWIGKTHCPTCGAELSYKNTADCHFTYGTSVAVGGLFRYFDNHSGRRCCRIENITSAIIGDDEYFVVKLNK